MTRRSTTLRRRSLSLLLAVTVVAVPTAHAAGDSGVVGPRPAVPVVAVGLPPLLAPPGALPTESPSGAGWPRPPALTSPVLLLVDAGSRQVLADRDAGLRRPVASTVKMLTAITVRRLLPDPTSLVVLGDEVADVEGAATGLAPGDVRTVRQLLEALLVRSGNDAGVALAVAASGSVPAFAREMERDARRLGVDGAVLRSPTGLEDANRLSAADLATIALALQDDPLLAQVWALPSIELPGPGVVANRNELLLVDPTVTGGKTGFTMAAGNGLVVTARRDGRELLAVVLGAADPATRFADAAALLDHAAAAFVPAPGLGRATIGCAGPDASSSAVVPVALVPAGATVALAAPGRACTADRVAFEVLFDGRPTARLDVMTERRDATGEATPDALLGAGLADLVQIALRTVRPEQ
jgi:D-alanyl-D-alanine carboxypeptidase (penicillin-binding protein 5/6)